MHALVVGGTGMLRNLTLHLSRKAEMVSLVARRPGELGSEPHINPLAVDYRETNTLRQMLSEAVDRFGPVDIAVCWVHLNAPEALLAIVNELSRSGRPFRLFHVRGSATADPTRPKPVPSGLEQLPAYCLYRQVILGFVVEGERSRWLTNEEISAGVIAAIEGDRAESVLGTVRPWEMRP